MNSRSRRFLLLGLALCPLLTPVVSPQNDGPFIYSFCMAIHLFTGWCCWKASQLYSLDKIRWQTVALTQGAHAVAYALAAQQGMAWVSATKVAWLSNVCIGAGSILLLPALMGVRSVRGKWVRLLDYLLAAAVSGLMARAMGSGIDPGNGSARATVITLVVLALTLTAWLARATSTRRETRFFSSVISLYLLATLATDFLLNVVNIDWLRTPNILLSDLLIALPELWLCDLILRPHQLPELADPEPEPVLIDSFQPSILAIGGVSLALYGLRGHAVLTGASIMLLMLCYALRTQLFYHQLFLREKSYAYKPAE